MGGDILDLFQAVEGGNKRDAILTLAKRFNAELPTNLNEWDRRQDAKTRTRALVERIKFETRCRRLFKAMILNDPVIQNEADPEVKRQEIQRAYKALEEGMRGIRL